MIVRISIMVLRVSFLSALILGIFFWNGHRDFWVPVHMGLGILVVLSLWVLGTVLASANAGSRGLAIGAFVLGLLVLAVGLTQQNVLFLGSAHWVIQVVHLLLGLAAIGIGEMIAGRYKRLSAPMLV